MEDKGPGVAKEELPHIFEPFYRGAWAWAAQIHGAGLGLSLAREITAAMGGRLTVQSQLGKGSAFTLHLQVAADGAFAKRDDGQNLAMSRLGRAERPGASQPQCKPERWEAPLQGWGGEATCCRASSE